MIDIRKINFKSSRSCYELDFKSIKHWTQTQWEKELEKDSVTAMGIYFNNSLVGVCVLHKIFNEAEIRYLAVHPSYKRKGLGKILIYKIFNECRDENIKKIFLEVSLKNEQALSFYDYCGFETIHIRKKYYRDGTDALIKEKKLNK